MMVVKKKIIYSESQLCFYVILNLDLVNPDFIIIMYHLELKPNSYKMTIFATF
jgi:hypothetical protein